MDGSAKKARRKKRGNDLVPELWMEIILFLQYVHNPYILFRVIATLCKTASEGLVLFYDYVDQYFRKDNKKNVLLYSKKALRPYFHDLTISRIIYLHLQFPPQLLITDTKLVDIEDHIRRNVFGHQLIWLKNARLELKLDNGASFCVIRNLIFCESLQDLLYFPRRDETRYLKDGRIFKVKAKRDGIVGLLSYDNTNDILLKGKFSYLYWLPLDLMFKFTSSGNYDVWEQFEKDRSTIMRYRSLLFDNNLTREMLVFPPSVEGELAEMLYIDEIGVNSLRNAALAYDGLGGHSGSIIRDREDEVSGLLEFLLNFSRDVLVGSMSRIKELKRVENKSSTSRCNSFESSVLIIQNPIYSRDTLKGKKNFFINDVTFSWLELSELREFYQKTKNWNPFCKEDEEENDEHKLNKVMQLLERECPSFWNFASLLIRNVDGKKDFKVLGTLAVIMSNWSQDMRYFAKILQPIMIPDGVKEMTLRLCNLLFSVNYFKKWPDGIKKLVREEMKKSLFVKKNVTGPCR